MSLLCHMSYFRVIDRCCFNRATSATYMNEHSSRSHAILIVEVTTCVKDGVPITAKLHLVDLAGKLVSLRLYSMVYHTIP